MNTELKVGSLLVSEPFMIDNILSRSVILLGEHDEDGTFGFILNKITDLDINQALKEFPNAGNKVYFGGVNVTDTIHFLHKFSKLPNRKEIIPGIYWGGDLDTMKKGIELGRIKLEDIRFFAGFCHWEPGDLEKEIEKKKWFVLDGTKELILPLDVEDLWGTILKKMGNSCAVLANFPEGINLN